MGVCVRCSSTIRQLHQDQPPPRNVGYVFVRLPTFRSKCVRSCWICYKFSQWLKVNNPKVFRAWRRRSLRVKFHRFAQFFSEEPQQNTLLPLFIDIVPAGYEGDSNSCGVELNFMPAAGNVTTYRYLALYRSLTLTESRLCRAHTVSAGTACDVPNEFHSCRWLDW